MIASRKQTSNSLDKPISQLKEKREELNRRLKDAKNQRQKLTNEIETFKRECKDLRRELQQGQSLNSKNYSASLASLQENEAAARVLEKEHKLNNDQAQLKRKNKLVNSIEPMIRVLEEEEKKLKELHGVQ